MKTQILQLNQNDDSLSVRDKMNWSQTGRILLVWPAKGCQLDRPLDLNLVKRHTIALGAQLALVTHDSEVRFYARKLGIRVFKNIRNAQDRDWGSSPPNKLDLQQQSHRTDLEEFRNNLQLPIPAWKENPLVRLFCLGISVLALIVLGVFILPGAKINLIPKVEIQTVNFDLTVIPALTSINLSTGSLPTYDLDVIVEGHDTITATGSMVFPDEPAVGNFKFTNISKQVLNLPAGTVVTTQGKEPIRFIILSAEAVTIDPNKSVDVTARAIKPGTSGNLRANKLTVIEGGYGSDVIVTNPSATYSDTDATVPTPSTQDFQILQARLIDQLNQVALTELHLILPAEDTLITPTLSIIETLEVTSLPAIGEPGNQLEVTMRLHFQSQAVSGDILRRLVTPLLDSNTPVGYSPINNSLVITQLNQPSLTQDGTVHWTVSAVRNLQVDIPNNRAIDIVKGSTIAEAKERLAASLPLEDQAQIELAPKWWPRLPLLTMRIQVAQAGVP